MIKALSNKEATVVDGQHPVRPQQVQTTISLLVTNQHFHFAVETSEGASQPGRRGATTASQPRTQVPSASVLSSCRSDCRQAHRPKSCPSFLQDWLRSCRYRGAGSGTQGGPPTAQRLALSTTELCPWPWEPGLRRFRVRCTCGSFTPATGGKDAAVLLEDLAVLCPPVRRPWARRGHCLPGERRQCTAAHCPADHCCLTQSYR